MFPRDWCFDWNHVGDRPKIMLRNKWLPLWYDNKHDYEHAHYVWVRMGKWSVWMPVTIIHPWSLFLEGNTERFAMAGKWKQK